MQGSLMRRAMVLLGTATLLASMAATVATPAAAFKCTYQFPDGGGSYFAPVTAGQTICGGPGNDTSKHITANWFKLLSEQIGVALIPVFNSANVDNVLIDGVQDENGTDVTVNTILAELS